MLENAANALVTELTKRLVPVIKEAEAEIKQFLGVGLNTYLKKQVDKYSKIKTLLRGNTPTFLYDIYYPLKLVSSSRNIESEKTDDDIDTGDIGRLLDAYNYLTLIGDAGSGKTTLVKHLFLNTITTQYAIPLLIELRYLNEYEHSFEDYIIEKIFENRLAENHKILNRLLEQGEFVFFLDGYDELNSNVKHIVTQKLNSFINLYHRNKFVLTARPYSEAEHLSLFTNLYVKRLGLRNKDIEVFVKKQLQNELELAEKIVVSISVSAAPFIFSFLRNPLLLSLYILTYQSDASIPDKKYIFYRRVINALFSEHDSKSKLGFVREKRSNLSQEQLEDVLKSFCFVSFFEAKYDWDYDYAVNLLSKIKDKKNIDFDIHNFIYDLKASVSLWVEDNGILAFAHRSLQEYFSALFIKNVNIETKSKVYEKLQAAEMYDVSGAKQINLRNILSLLLEMDRYHFTQCFHLPLITNLYSKITDDSDVSLIKSIIQLFINSIDVVLNNPENVNPTIYPRDLLSLNVNIYRSLYIDIDDIPVRESFPQKFYTVLRHFSEDGYTDNRMIREYIDSRKNQLPVKVYPDKMECVTIDTNINIPEPIIQYCYEQLLSDMRAFKDKIEKLITINSDYLASSKKSDADIIDLI